MLKCCKLDTHTLLCCRDTKKQSTPAFEIPVPPGTVVKRKSNGLLLGDLTNKGASCMCIPVQVRVSAHVCNL